MPAYVWVDNAWKTINGVYVYVGGAWKTIQQGYVWENGSWKNIFSSGTFFPRLRIPGNTGTLTRRSVGLAIELYRGSTASGTYSYQFQYAQGDQVSWSNQTATNNSGTLTGATTTTNYTTDSSDLFILENLSTFGNNTGILDDIDTYRTQEAKNMYMRARVIKSGETQFTQNIIIHKREPVNSGSTLTLRRASSGLTYTITGNPSTDKQPYVGDTLFWTPSFTNTTTITNDTRPDYYWFNFDTNGGPNYRNSILSDPANPRNPVNARSYTIQSSDLGGPVVCTMRGINTNPAGTGSDTVFISTRDVSDGTLTAPINLVLQYVNLNLVGSWDAAGGGNDSTITYTWYLERSIDGGPYSQIASGNTTTLTFSSSQTTAGRYRFYVVAAQTGNPSVTSGFSNIFELQSPASFNVTIQNVTNSTTYQPSVFSINAPVVSPTVLNQYDWTWTQSTITGPEYAKTGSFNITTIGSWLSTIIRPDGTFASVNQTNPSGSWLINQSGNHTHSITARNVIKNYVRVSWTKPAGTSAASYRVVINAYRAPDGFLDWTRTINVGDVTFVDIEHDFNTNGTWATGSAVLVSSVTAYNGANQTGVTRTGTIPPFSEFGADGTTSWSGCNVIGTRNTQRTDNLTLENPTASFIYLTATNFEPGNTISVTGNRPSTGVTGWNPSFESAGWTHFYQWYRKGTVNFQSITGATSSTFFVPNNSTYVGDVVDVEVFSTYKGQTFGSRFDSTSDTDSRIVPPPPTFTVVDNGNRTFSIGGISSTIATFYYGSYSGTAGSGTIPETAIASTYVSPQLLAGNVNVTLFFRRKVNLVWPSSQTNVSIDSRRSTTVSQTINPSAQDTGSRRLFSSVPSISAGTDIYISTNGFYGNNTVANNNYFVSNPSPGGFFNIAGRDLVMSYCYTLVDNGGIWIRYRGEEYPSGTNRWLEYQAYNRFDGTGYMLIIENSLSTYRANVAYTLGGVTQNTWSAAAADSSSLTTNQGTSGWTLRSVTTGSNDDGVIQFTVIRPGRPMRTNPTVTRTAGGFTFNVVNDDDGLFESAATYGVSINLSSPAAVSINSSTGLVTVTGLTSSQFATVTVSKSRTGYSSVPNLTVQGQALAGSPPTQAIAPSISASGTADGSGTVRRIQSGGTVSGSAGTYNNQQSISSGLLTILSNSYTGADSNWTLAGSLGNSTPIGDSAAAGSANMYRWRDRVVGTDGSTVDFYSSVIYRAVYAPPAGVSQNAALTTTTQIGVNFTGYGAQRIYRFRDFSQVDFITGFATSGPTTTTYTGLSAGTPYYIQLYGGNSEGYLSVNAGGNVNMSTNGANLTAPTISTVTQTSPNGSLSVSFTGGSGPFYQIWWQSGADFSTVTGFDASGSSSPVVDASGPGAGTWNVAVRSVSNASNTGTGPSSTISAWSAPRSFTVSAGSTPPSTPTITGNNTLPLGGTFSWTFTGGTAPFTYSVFCSGPTGTVYTTSNQYTWGTASFRPAYDGTGGTNGTGWQGSGTYQISVSVRDSAGLTSSAGSGSTFMS